jgi:cyclopropane-fatty-acyl-phospholipid synthase
MNDKGVALIHSIGHMGPLGTASKYIFRGAYTPALSKVLKLWKKKACGSRT